MDPMTDERLSRYLDGDLDAAEAELLEARLAAEPELVAELEALRQLQRHVRAVAERMEPTSDLDATLVPLRRGGPPARRALPPAVRWIGIAAGLALAATVALEVARRPQEPLPPATRRAPTPAPPPSPSEFFQLKPLPTTTTPEEKQPLGAADRLLASPLAEAPLPEPEALDVRGPLAEEEMAGRAGEAPSSGTGRREADSRTSPGKSGAVTSERQRGASDHRIVAGAESAAGSVVAPAATLKLQDEAKAMSAAEAGDTKKEAAPPVQLVLVGADGDRVAELEVPPEVGALARRAPKLVVTVADGVIVAVEAGGPRDADGSALGALEGRAVPGVPDGRYRGSVEGREPSR